VGPGLGSLERAGLGAGLANFAKMGNRPANQSRTRALQWVDFRLRAYVAREFRSGKSSRSDGQNRRGRHWVSEFLVGHSALHGQSFGRRENCRIPRNGRAYFDVVSFHSYPVFGPGSSDEGVAGFLGLRDELGKRLADAKTTGKNFVVTETGAPHIAVGGAPGGGEYAPNYLVKVMVSAQAAGIERVDWFSMSDGKPAGASTNSFDYMGLYLDVSKLGQTSEAKRTESGQAYRTLGKLLAGANFDITGTATLGLPATVDGRAFRLADNRRALVLWAKTKGASETASAMFAIPTDKPLQEFGLDYGDTGAMNEQNPSGGTVMAQLSGTPRIYIEKP
jgi:hypothetical protein